MTGASTDMPDPMTGKTFMKVPDTQVSELAPFVQSLRSVPKSGLHNPIKVKPHVHCVCHSPRMGGEGGRGGPLGELTRTLQRASPWQKPLRYLLYGDVSAKAAQMLRDPEVEHFFTRLIQRVAPKSYVQGELATTTSTHVSWTCVCDAYVGRRTDVCESSLNCFVCVYCWCFAAKGEVTICRVFFENFSGDQVRPAHTRAPTHKHPHTSTST